MSLKYAATKVSEGHYVLPKTKDMKVDAHAYLSEALYEASDETLWDQLRNGASYEGVTGAYIMPDAHMGYGVPIGSVIVTEDTLIQAGSGYDISCGVLYMSTGLMAADIADLARRRQWIEEIVQRSPNIPTSWFNWGVCLSTLGRESEAAEKFLKAYELAPDDYGAQYRAFRSLFFAQDYAAFLEFATQECDAHPEMIEHLLADDDFSTLFARPEFQELRDRYQK